MYREYPQNEMQARAAAFLSEMKRRRSVRQFAARPVPRKIIEDCLAAACTAPSGANLQPWKFAVVSDPDVKRRIRREAEKVEREFYSAKATRKWAEAVSHLNTGPSKAFLETAPYLIAIFAQRYSRLPDGGKRKHYYVTESVGIATGLLITALHHAGLASLTYTPVKMKFLNRILSRPANEKPFVILVAGYPADDAVFAAIDRKAPEEVVEFI